MPVSAADQFDRAALLSVERLRLLTDRDWSVPASPLDWSCWETVDHMVDCLFSYAVQLAGRRPGGWLPLSELHVLPGTPPPELVDTLEAVSRVFVSVLRTAPETATASDGVLPLALEDWAARGAYELLLHTSDVCAGLAVTFEPPHPLCAWMLASTALWMFDRDSASVGQDPWERALRGSGRPSLS
jgi:hypothetical protein